MKDQEPEDGSVRGERGSATLARAPSVQSRISNLLAIGLMSILGLGMLTWYYANAMTRQSHARESAQASSAKRAQSGDMPLAESGQDRSACCGEAAAEIQWPASWLHCWPRRCARFRSRPRRPSLPYGAAPAKTPAQLTLERQLSGAVFSQSSLPMAPAAGATPPGCGAGAGRAERAAAAKRHDRGSRPGVADAAVAATQGRVSRLHLGNGHRLHLARHDHLRHGNRHLRC